MSTFEKIACMKIRYSLSFWGCLILLFLSSCYKEDVHIVANTGISNMYEGLKAEMYIAERQSIFCKQYDSNGDSTQIELNLSTLATTPQNYVLPTISYWAKSQNEIYSAQEVPFSNQVIIYDLLTGATVETVNYPYPVNKACIANGKLYVSESTISNNVLNVYDAVTKTFISKTVVGSGNENLAVSADGSRVFTSKESNGTTYSVSFSNNVLNYQYLKVLSPFNFTPNTYSISNDGGLLVTDQGKIFNEKLVNLITLSNGGFAPFRKLYVSSDKKNIIAMTDYTLFIYDATTYHPITEHKLEYDASWKFTACFPYFDNDKLRIVANAANYTAKRLLIY